MDEPKAGVSPISGTAPPAWGKWQPGQTGNPEGGRLHKRYKLAIEIAMAKLSEKNDPLETEVQMAAAQVAKAIAGDTGAYHEIIDRLHGKVPTPIGGTDELPAIKGFAWLNPTTTASSE